MPEEEGRAVLLEAVAGLRDTGRLPASRLAAALTPAFAWWLDGPRMAVVTGFMAVLIFIRHHANIGRILAGTEPRIGRKG